MIKGDLYTMEFPGGQDDSFKKYGSSYVMKLESESREFMVHFPTLIRFSFFYHYGHHQLHHLMKFNSDRLISIAADAGLNMLEITNLLEFFEDNRQVFLHSSFNLSNYIYDMIDIYSFTDELIYIHVCISPYDDILF